MNNGTVREVTAKIAARRQYIGASERLAEEAVRKFLDHQPEDAKKMATWANDIRRWGKAEVCE